VYSFKNNIVVC